MTSGRSLLTSFGASALIQALNVMTGVLLARALAPEARGELAAVVLWPTILALVGNLGVVEAATYKTARNAAPIGTLLGSALLIVALQSLPLMLLCAGVVHFVFADASPNSAQAAYLFVAFIPATLVTLTGMALLNGAQAFRAFNTARVLVILMSAVGLVALAGAGKLTVLSAAAVYLGATLLTGGYAVRALAPLGVGRLRPSRPLMRDLLRLGWRTHVSTVGSALNQRLDQLVMSVAVTPAQLGLYVIAVTLTSLTSIFGVSVAHVALPNVARTTRTSLVSIVRRYVSITTLVCSLVTIPLLILTPQIVTIAFGEAYAGASDPARILLLAMAIYSTGRVLGSVLKALGIPLIAGFAELAGLATTVVALAILLPLWGITGAALASLIAYGVSTSWMLIKTSRIVDTRPLQLLLPDKSTTAALVDMTVRGGATRKHSG